MITRRIPAGAIMVDLPDVRQPDDYSCGAGILMSIACFYGVGPMEIEDFKKALGTNPIYGTYHRDIARYANELGLNAEVTWDMSKRRLQSLLRHRVPVILSIQAWAEDEAVYLDPDHNKDGHYVGAIGYDRGDNFYFMDPSITARRGFLSWPELDRRWHEDEGFEEAEVHRHLGIIIKPGRRRGAQRAWRIK